MSKISDYLRQHLAGEVATDATTRQAMSHDGSILEVAPQLVVYPRTTNDVRKVMRFSWRLAERGQVLPITARGGGTSPTGAAIGSGVMLSFPAHMAHILELDVKSRLVRAQPGINFAALQEAMATQGLFVPVFPPDFKAATLGGALASDVSGFKSVKYGKLRDWTDRLEVVLANGEIIQTEKLSSRALSSKKGLQTMEGEVYRAVDALIDENAELIDGLDNEATFALNQVKKKDSFDLTPLLVGSEGTLGVITQAIVRLAPNSEDVGLIAAALTPEQNLADLTEQLMALDPSELEFIDGATLKLIEEKGGGASWNTVSKTRPATLIFIEFDDKQRERKVKKAAKILAAAGIVDAEIAEEFEDQETLRSIHHSVAFLTNYADNGTAALPLASTIVVESGRVAELVQGAKGVLQHNHIEGGVWGSLGSGTVTVMPLLNLANLGQRQAVFKFMNEMRELAKSLGGSILHESGGGRLGAPFVNNTYGPQLAKVFDDLKKIFDPYNMLNPGVKVGLTQENLVAIMRKDYDRARFSELNLRG